MEDAGKDASMKTQHFVLTGLTAPFYICVCVREWSVTLSSRRVLNCVFFFIAQAVTINYHHTTGSRAPSLDDDEEEEDRLHAMISMICSRNLTDPNVMKGFYHQWPTS